MRAQAKLHVAPTTTHGHQRPNEAQDVLHRWFLPRKESRLMSEEAARTGGVWLPYPVMGFLLTLTMALVAGLVGLYSQLSSMQTTMILRDSSYQQQVKELKEKVDLQGMYITDLREKLIRVESKPPNRKGG